MKNKKFLAFANLVLGSLVMLFAGCHSQKNAAKTAEKESQDANLPQVEQTAPDEGRILVKYGVPPVKERKKFNN